MPATSLKRCPRCPPGQQQHPRSDFGKHVGTPDGLRAYCKVCSRKYQEERRQKRTDALPALDAATFAPLAPWGTAFQRTCVDALVRAGSVAAAAEALCVTPLRLRGSLSELERRAARQGYAPGHDMTHTVPEGLHVKGISTLYRADGSISGQWVKTQADRETKIEDLLTALERLAEPFKAIADPAPKPRGNVDDLLTVIPFGDPHFGMQSWAEETGENFDLKIAEEDLQGAVDHLVALGPPTREALIVSLGDMFHSDSNAATTTRGTRVDVDTRWAKVLGVGIRAMRRCIDTALTKHEKVTFVPVCGNHDEHTSLVLGLVLANYYEREPRVTIDTSPGAFHWYRFGRVLIGMTHGHSVKKEQLPSIMACDRKEDWSSTDHRYWLTGHIHHETVKEFPGVVVESFRTLAARDAWHTLAGYRAGRDLRLDVYHRDHGRVNRHIVGLSQLHGGRR